MATFVHEAQVGVHHETTVDVVDAQLGVAGSSGIELEVSLSADGVRIEVNLVGTNSVNRGDVHGGSVIRGVDNLVGEIGDILHVHKDTTTIGTKVDGTRPFGLREGKLVLGDTGVGEVVTDGELASLLAHGGHGDTLKVGIGLPCSAAFLGEDTGGGTDIDGTSGILNEGAVSGDGGIAQGDKFDGRVGAGIVEDGNIGEIRGEVLESKDDAILTVALVDHHVADGTWEPSITVVVDCVDVENTAGDIVPVSIGDVLVGEGGGEVHILEMGDADSMEAWAAVSYTLA